MTHRVAVFGGGVAGLTVAHELARVGEGSVQVTVYERNPDLGGKARSFGKAKSVPAAHKGNALLPGEHGFRFFPGYYRHVIQTMERIPYPAAGAGASTADNLVAAPETHFARLSGKVIEMPNRFPTNIEELAQIATFGGQVDIPFDEACRFAWALRRMLCACDDRRKGQFEHISWFKFIEGEKCGPDYSKYLADGLNQRTVAASGHDVSARTVGLTLVRIMTDWLRPGSVIDRVLNGPTSDRWITPWRDHLVDLGVTFESATTLREVQWSPDVGITAAKVEGAAGVVSVVADSYVVALPLADAREVAERSGMVGAGIGLDGLPKLGDDWMNGLQLYLAGSLDLAAGHTIYVDSEFALTSVSQGQFWPDLDLSTVGDGSVEAILSLDISDWRKPCRHCGKAAEEMTRKQVKDHVIAQVEDHLEASYGVSLPPVVDWFLDPAITEKKASKGGPRLANREGLFINRTGSWVHRPEATTKLPNLFLASDYVRTQTDLATMEGANEAGRLAVRGVLASRSELAHLAADVELFSFDEPTFFERVRDLDKLAYSVLGAPPIDGAAPPPPPMPELPDSWEVTPQP